MSRPMILWVLALHCCLLNLIAGIGTPKGPRCATPYMTEVQSWVDELGTLLPNGEEEPSAIDVSAVPNPVAALSKKLSTFRIKKNSVRYLSLARCELSTVPAVFHFRDARRRYLFTTLEYITLYGNNFSTIISEGEMYEMNFNATDATETNLGVIVENLVNAWSVALTTVRFPSLKELDLRACSIEFLGANLFQRMPNLKALYIGENKIKHIDRTSFNGLNNLIHLDFSRNVAFDENGSPITFYSHIDFGKLENLAYLDFSYTRMSQKNLPMIRSLGRNLRSLSLCDTGLPSLNEDIFRRTSIEVLDLSRNNGILNIPDALRGLENTLRGVSARATGLQFLEPFRYMTKLEVLQISHNEISNINDHIISNLTNLEILDLDSNRLTSWFGPKYSLIPKLRYLSLKDNNLNVITEEMIEDIMRIDYISLSDNFMVCNCHAKDLFKMAAKNEVLYNDTLFKMSTNKMTYSTYNYYNRIINDRLEVEIECEDNCYKDLNDTGTVRIVDYHPSVYTCLLVQESKSVMVANLKSCSMVVRETDLDKELTSGKRKLLALLALPCIILSIVIILIYRTPFRYFYITIRNSAMLSLINKNEAVSDNTIFNYDVFVSYCNEDREWVLEHLLPHIEAACNISVCLHERDFQVGLSILENIVSCMDRSKSIMLIISQKFLLSQWCQFEMHLAQHRLLETRREDLTLVLLEEIPRRVRPNTLHYLMLTKTYIVWPKDKSERPVFWRRLKKTLISQKIKHADNVSLA